MNRRQFLSGLGTAGLLTISGCNSPPTPSISMSVPDTSDYFDSVEYTAREHFLGADTSFFVVSLHRNLPEKPTTIILLLDDEQYSFERVGTGASTVRFDQMTTPETRNLDGSPTVEIAAVTGGEEDSRQWVGGKILERVEITVEIDT